MLVDSQVHSTVPSPLVERWPWWVSAESDLGREAICEQVVLVDIVGIGPVFEG